MARFAAFLFFFLFYIFSSFWPYVLTWENPIEGITVWNLVLGNWGEWEELPAAIEMILHCTEREDAFNHPTSKINTQIQTLTHENFSHFEILFSGNFCSIKSNVNGQHSLVGENVGGSKESCNLLHTIHVVRPHTHTPLIFHYQGFLGVMSVEFHTHPPLCCLCHTNVFLK